MSRRVELATVLALVTALTVWVTWGALRPLPVVQDEYSYVLQAQIFAHGHWTAPAPPVPSSFQQAHVLSVPRVASKYPPGHALMLALGALAGTPWLMSLLLSGISGALVFLLSGAIAGRWIGIACWAIWLGDPINLRFSPGYYSEITSGLMWLVSWWLLLSWRADKRGLWLMALAVAIGWMAITRPLTALAFAIPVGIWVVMSTVRRHHTRQLAAALLLGTAVVAILPLWSASTTGRWSLSPEELYRQDYLPFDKPGFGIDTTAPRLGLSAVNADVYTEFSREHRGYTVAHVPVAAAARLKALFTAEWPRWRLLLVPFVVIGIIFAPRELWFAVACGAALFVAYLSYAHWPGWTIYYFEAIPVVAFCAGNGIAVLGRYLKSRTTSARLVRTLAVTGALGLGAMTIATIAIWRRIHIDNARYDTAFENMIAGLGTSRAVVFVRYAPDFHPHTTVVHNSATLSTDSVWVAIDDPANNATLIRAAPGRVPFLFDEKAGTLRVYTSLLSSIRGHAGDSFSRRISSRD